MPNLPWSGVHRMNAEIRSFPDSAAKRDAVVLDRVLTRLRDYAEGRIPPFIVLRRNERLPFLRLHKADAALLVAYIDRLDQDNARLADELEQTRPPF